MQRDIDFMRELLLKYEADDSPLIITTLEGSTEKDNFHIQLLCDAGLLMKTNTNTYRITNDGHDFIANISDKTIWKKTKEKAKKLGNDAIPILGKIALDLVLEKLER